MLMKWQPLLGGQCKANTCVCVCARLTRLGLGNQRMLGSGEEAAEWSKVMDRHKKNVCTCRDSHWPLQWSMLMIPQHPNSANCNLP